MTLTRRLNLFFLAAMAVVLVVFSAAIYLLADTHLTRQLDDRLGAAAHNLASAAEIEPDGVDWEPHFRPLTTAPGVFGDQLHWVVTTDDGLVIDRSSQPGVDEFLAAADAAIRSGHRNPRRFDHGGQSWQITQIRVVQESLPSNGRMARGKYPALVLTVAVPLEPVQTTLRIFATALVGLTIAVLTVAMFVGRLVCRRALAPVSQMADAARLMGVADLSQRLPAPASGDELTDLGGAFNGLLDRLAEAFERERRFAGEASHQLRTPIAAVIGQVEVALRRERDPEEYRRVLQSVFTQAGRLRRVVEGLLFLARSESDAGLPGLERVDLAEWVTGWLRQWNAHARAEDIAFEKCGGEPLLVAIHPDLFGELLDALVDNAMKYSEPGTPVVVRVGRDVGQVSLTVADRGCGISATELQQVFRPFFRSEAARKLGVPGSGLGLAIAARIATALGGSITAESEPSRGSQFRVQLPAAQSELRPSRENVLHDGAGHIG